jgi:hypothetical protein
MPNAGGTVFSRIPNADGRALAYVEGATILTNSAGAACMGEFVPLNDQNFEWSIERVALAILSRGWRGRIGSMGCENRAA